MEDDADIRESVRKTLFRQGRTEEWLDAERFEQHVRIARERRHPTKPPQPNRLLLGIGYAIAIVGMILMIWFLLNWPTL